MYKLLMVLGTILATGWFAPAQADETDWDVFAEKICSLAMRDPANRPACAKRVSARDGTHRNYFKTIQDECRMLDFRPDTYGYEAFMIQSFDCYTDGMKMINLNGADSVARTTCNDGGDHGWVIQCYDVLISRLLGESKGNDSNTNLVADTTVTDVIPGSTTIVTSAEVGVMKPIPYAAIEAKVQKVWDRQWKKTRTVGAIRSWSCAVSEKSIEACTLYLDIPTDWCYGHHFELKFRVDPSTGNTKVTFYDFVKDY